MSRLKLEMAIAVARTEAEKPEVIQEALWFSSREMAFANWFTLGRYRVGNELPNGWTMMFDFMKKPCTVFVRDDGFVNFIGITPKERIQEMMAIIDPTNEAEQPPHTADGFIGPEGLIRKMYGPVKAATLRRRGLPRRIGPEVPPGSRGTMGMGSPPNDGYLGPRLNR